MKNHFLFCCFMNHPCDENAELLGERNPSRSQYLKIDFNVHFDCDGMPIFHRRFELVLTDRFDRLLIQSHSQTPHNMYMHRMPFLVDL